MQRSSTTVLPTVRLGRRPIYWTAIISGMAVLMVAVGVLQYRWTSQITAATEIRIGRNIQSQMMDWHLDFYSQFASICVALQVGPDSGAQDNWNAYRQRYLGWRSRVINPSLVSNVYIWETSRDAGPRLLRITAADAPVEGPPPAELRQLLERLRNNSSSIAQGLGAWRLSEVSSHSSYKNPILPSFTPRGDSLTGWQFDQNVPAIVHPIIHHRLPPETDDLDQHGAVDWIVVELDQSTIQAKILPELSREHFEGRQRLEYMATVSVGRGGRRIMYCSNSADVSDAAKADATMNIFGPPPESTEGHFWEAVKNGNALESTDWHDFAAPVWFPVIRYGSDQPPWML